MALREKDRSRRQRRRIKLRNLKEKLSAAVGSNKRRRFVEKIRVLEPWYQGKGLTPQGDLEIRGIPVT
jgi:hypothetical protein